jgi:hypothetical protein
MGHIITTNPLPDNLEVLLSSVPLPLSLALTTTERHGRPSRKRASKMLSGIWPYRTRAPSHSVCLELSAAPIGEGE